MGAARGKKCRPERMGTSSQADIDHPPPARTHGTAISRPTHPSPPCVPTPEKPARRAAPVGAGRVLASFRLGGEETRRPDDDGAAGAHHRRELHPRVAPPGEPVQRRQPLRRPHLALVHGLRGPQPPPVGLHPVVSAREFAPARGGAERGRLDGMSRRPGAAALLTVAAVGAALGGCLRRSDFVPPPPPLPLGPAAPTPAPPPPGTPLTAADAVRLVLERNPSLRAADARVAEARAGLAQAEAAFWPRLSADVSYLVGDAPSA